MPRFLKKHLIFLEFDVLCTPLSHQIVKNAQWLCRWGFRFEKYKGCRDF